MSIHRRGFLKLAGAALAGVLWSGGLSATGAEPPPVLPSGSSRPNILFIFSDDHSLQTIGAYNSRLSEFCRQQNVTPNIDRLAAEGALFPNSFCCNSLCSPSRAAVLSGLHSHANGVRNLSQSISPGLWTFPGALQAAGYQTALVGKWHLGNSPQDMGLNYWAVTPGNGGSYWNSDFLTPAGKEAHEGYITDLTTDLGLAWLKRRDPSKPFMLMVHHKATHEPWMPPPRYYHWLAEVQIPEPPTLFDDYAGRGTPAHTQKMEIGRDMGDGDVKTFTTSKVPGEFQRMTEGQRAAWLAAFSARNAAFRQANLQGQDLTRWKYQQYMKDYLRCVKGVDDSVGQLLDYLKQEGLEQNTVVIYSSDQGYFNGEHGWYDKRWVYEESLHMPFIIRWPGVVQPGSRPEAMIQNIDYAPTFVEIAGGTVPAGLHGRSLLPLLRGQTPADWRTSIYYDYYDPGHNMTRHDGVRTQRYTLACFYPLGEWELYDLQKDPQQMHSVYADPAYAATVAELKGELTRLRTQYQVPQDTQGKRP